MFTTVAWSVSQDTGGVLTYVPALADQHVRVELNNIVVPAGMNYLCGAFAIGTTITRAQIESPALRRTLILDLPGINVGTEPLVPTPFFDAFYDPIPLDEFEPLRALTAEGAAGAERGTVVVWLGDGPQSSVSGEIYTVRATWSGALTAYEWTNRALTFTQVLPAGRYAVVGMTSFSDGAIAARLVFVGGTWRPGCIGYDSHAEQVNHIFRRGKLGVWGEFAHDQPPTVDLLAVSGDASGVVHLDLIKVM